ncbi:hypothetical protein SAMN05421837_10462 [Amycolatopsis pretoriensis]|uniref:Uncharacterized protein n=1 Tax=Amycolatopsis pretoriensis TaxID=218821 RepID=A0A1H5QQW1_9PSEU|nr:hypothetical protein [Amycolatopsis pretoriensis]SEF28214.1 hypothetical protein SAMN05421837_10462 [Amycolatopsis pretoriensis]
MGKQFTRITALGFTSAASAALFAFAMPAVASADPSPTLGGDCSATLQNGQARDAKTGLVLDAGAPLNAPNQLTVGLDSSARNTNGSAPLLTLPVGDTVRALGIGDVPVVGDAAAKTVCPAAQSVVNTVGGVTQGVAGELPPLPLPPNPAPPAPPAPPGPTPPGQTPPGDSTGPVTTGPGNAGLPGDAISGIFSNASLLPGSLVQAPVIAQIIPGRQVPTVDEQKSGTAEALPGVTPPAKLPMLLAVLALAIVAAALVRAWIRRKPA